MKNKLFSINCPDHIEKDYHMKDKWFINLLQDSTDALNKIALVDCLSETTEDWIYFAKNKYFKLAITPSTNNPLIMSFIPEKRMSFIKRKFIEMDLKDFIEERGYTLSNIS